MKHLRQFLVLAVGSAVVACFSPSYDAPMCGATGACPSGYTCGASNVCVLLGTGTDGGGGGGGGTDGGGGGGGGGTDGGGGDAGTGSACPFAASYTADYGSDQNAYTYSGDGSTAPYQLISWTGRLTGSADDPSRVDLGIQVESGNDVDDDMEVTTGTYDLQGITDESFAIVELLTDVGSGSDDFAHTLYLAMSGTLHVTTAGSDGDTFTGTIHPGDFVRYDVESDGHVGSADPDGCTTNVGSATFSAIIQDGDD